MTELLLELRRASSSYSPPRRVRRSSRARSGLAEEHLLYIPEQPRTAPRHRSPRVPMSASAPLRFDGPAPFVWFEGLDPRPVPRVSGDVSGSAALVRSYPWGRMAAPVLDDGDDRPGGPKAQASTGSISCKEAT